MDDGKMRTSEPAENYYYYYYDSLSIYLCINCYVGNIFLHTQIHMHGRCLKASMDFWIFQIWDMTKNEGQKGQGEDLVNSNDLR